MKITVIGLGHMGRAIIGGILARGVHGCRDIIGADSCATARQEAEDLFAIATAADNANAVRGAGLVILAVRPGCAADVLAAIRQHMPPGAVVMSVMAGKRMAWLEEQLRGGELTDTANENGGGRLTEPVNTSRGRRLTEPVKIIRAMPNLPALIGAGMSGVCRNAHVTDDEMAMALGLLRSFGEAEEVGESLMDAVVGLSGSGPAYVFLFIDALIAAAVAAGMPPEQARRFAVETVIGSARMAGEAAQTPAELCAMVATPGGTTIEAMGVFAAAGFRETVIAAATAAMAKSRQM